MTTRDKLKAMIDEIPEDRLDIIRITLEHHLNPRAWASEMQCMRERSREYRKLVEQRFRKTQRPGTILGMTGDKIPGVGAGSPYGRHGFTFWDGKAVVHHALQSFDGQDIEIMERFAMAPGRVKLLCSLEVSTGGRTVRREEEFPISAGPAQQKG